jgi:PleD family two-component response regulator
VWRKLARAVAMNRNGHHIQVIGQRSPLLEGVSDLLQLAGYQVDVSSSWSEIEYLMQATTPNLVIVDLSNSAPDPSRLSDHIRTVSNGAEVPILFVSFSGDGPIRELQSRNEHGNGSWHFYVHNLLGMNGLLSKVEACLAWQNP